ncbi:Uncharacterised protein [Klebsiella pneumoniae]|nr:Uncharacterised protein [Klebsiella pneumoniae]
MSSVTVRLCHCVVTPSSHGDCEVSQFTGSLRLAINPTVSELYAVMASDILNSNVTVRETPASTGIRVMFATRTEPVVVRMAFSLASQVKPEPVPESSHSEASVFRLPLPIRLPSDRLFSSIVTRSLCELRASPCCDTVFCRFCRAEASAFFVISDCTAVRSLRSETREFP